MTSALVEMFMWPRAASSLILAAVLRWVAAQLVFWADYFACNLYNTSQKLESAGKAQEVVA